MKTAAVIPAYNEEETIAEVVNIIKQVREIDEVIVVSDGSTDATAECARLAGAEVVDLPENLGKGAAMKIGVDRTDAGVILFLDADLIGLKPRHVLDLLAPVLGGRAEMSIGIFEGGRIATDLAQVVAPYLSGLRAVRRELLAAISDLEIARFGVEIALTKHVRKAGARVVEVGLDNLTHRMKEEKLGLVKGFTARMKMYWEIMKTVQRR